MTTVRQLLDQKGREILSIDPSATVFDAVAKMAEKDVGSLVVMDDDEIVGMITERHYARNVVLKGKTSPGTPISDIMEKNVVVVQPEQSVEQCMAIMTDKRIRHLPVLDGEKLIESFRSAISSRASSAIRNSRLASLSTTFTARADNANGDLHT